MTPNEAIEAKLDQILAGQATILRQISALGGIEPKVDQINDTVNATAGTVGEIAEGATGDRLREILRKHELGDHAAAAGLLNALKALARGEYEQITAEEAEAFLTAHPDFKQIRLHPLFHGQTWTGFPRSLRAIAYVLHFQNRFVLFEDFMKEFDSGFGVAAKLRQHCLANPGYCKTYTTLPFHLAAAFYASMTGLDFDPSASARMKGWDMDAFLHGSK